MTRWPEPRFQLQAGTSPCPWDEPPATPVLARLFTDGRESRASSRETLRGCWATWPTGGLAVI